MRVYGFRAVVSWYCYLLRTVVEFIGNHGPECRAICLSRDRWLACVVRDRMRRCSRCWPAARRVTQPESTSHDAGDADNGESAHFHAMKRLYLSAPVNQFFPSRLIIDEDRKSIRLNSSP